MKGDGKESTLANVGKSGGMSIQFSLDAITREIGTASPHLFNG